MSGIYIFGISMPEDKAIAVVIHPDGIAYSAEMFAGVCTNYLTDCEAVPIPEHGRLIDADALCEGRVSNDNVVICAKAAPTIIPADPADKGERDEA